MTVAAPRCSQFWGGAALLGGSSQPGKLLVERPGERYPLQARGYIPPARCYAQPGPETPSYIQLPYAPDPSACQAARVLRILGPSRHSGRAAASSLSGAAGNGVTQSSSPSPVLQHWGIKAPSLPPSSTDAAGCYSVLRAFPVMEKPSNAPQAGDLAAPGLAGGEPCCRQHRLGAPCTSGLAA